jgi:hypothetical protein
MSFIIYFYKIGEQEGKTCLAWGLVPVGQGGRRIYGKEGEYGINTVLLYTHV